MTKGQLLRWRQGWHGRLTPPDWDPPGRDGMLQPASRRAVMPTMDQTVCTGPSLDAEYDLTTSCLGKYARPSSVPRLHSACRDSRRLANGYGRAPQPPPSRAHAHFRRLCVYAIAALVRRGAFSKVYVVIHRGTGEKRAVKRIEKRLMGTSTKGSRAIDLSPVETEIALQKECCVNTDNIVKIFDVFDSGNTVDIVLESMLKDDLFDAIEKVYYPEEGEIQHHECRYTELEASKIARQLISAVNACHEHNVCHRDLKPENILVHEYHPLCPVVKLCDFGLAARCAEGDQLTDACGTPEYVAPEVIAKLGYDLSADVWSIGVIVFILLCGEQPFHSNLEGRGATTEVLEQVSSFTSIEDKCTVGDWAIISDDAKSLLQNHLLVRDPSKRMTAHDLLEHQWVCGQAAPTKAIPSALALHHKRWLRRKFRVAIYTLVATNRIRSLVRSLKVAKLDSEGSFSLGQGGALDAVSAYEKLLREFVENDQDGTSMLDSNTFVRVLKSNSVGVGKETEHFTIFADAFTGGSMKRANYRDYCIGLMWRWHGPLDEKLKCAPLLCSKLRLRS